MNEKNNKYITINGDFDKNLYATATKEEKTEMFADMMTELLKAADGSVGKAIRLVEKQHLPKKIRSVKKFLLRTLRMYKRWTEGLAIGRRCAERKEKNVYEIAK